MLYDMCRMFGILGGADHRPERWLTRTDCSLLAQSNFSAKQPQRDGWGIAWYEDGRAPRLERGVRGAFEATELSRFRAIARACRGPVVVGHLRHASNPMGLPRDRLLGLENSQPFVEGSRVFAHNGMISFPRETLPLLEGYRERVKGVNDSEVLFYLFLRHFDATGDPRAAYESARKDLVAIWKSKGRSGPGPYTGLNILFVPSPDAMWAFCESIGEHGGGLCQRDRPYYQMAYYADATQLIVASEPLDRNRTAWTELANGHYVHGSSTDGAIDVESGVLEPVELESAASPTSKGAAVRG